jgi:4-hydroxy-2-oxovalerate aldolase
MIKIIENTLRDGSYEIDFKFSEKNTLDIVTSLDKAGFEYIEVGHGLGLGAYNQEKFGIAQETDEVYIKAARRAAEQAKISAFFIPGIGSIGDLTLAKSNGLDLIRCGINISNYKELLPYLEHAKNIGLEVAVNLMKSYAVKSYEFSKITNEVSKWELADVIYLVDSAGCMFPSEIKDYVERAVQECNVPIGFHGHNNLTLGIANTLQAINSGATFVDSCIRGMGRSAGNAQTEILVIALQRLGLFLNIDIYELYKIAEELVAPLMRKPQGLIASEVHIGYSKFHSSYSSILSKAAEKYGVSSDLLMKAVCDINCLNPSDDLFETQALELQHN